MTSSKNSSTIIMTIKDAQHLHFIGIGGIGISALARMCVHRGITVTGTNDGESKETLDGLRAQGVEITLSTNPQDVPEADAYVYSVAWEGRAPAVVDAARTTGKPVLTYFAALGQMSAAYKRVVAISGTHGKTTTTAMTAQALIAAGLDPTVIVGSLVDWGDGVRSNFRAGSSDLLVVEACEYRRHFLNFHPYIFAITNIEHDHPDYYKDLADVQEAFAQASSQAEVILDEDDWDDFLPVVPELKVPGEHNRKNAALALAICDALGADVEKAKDALTRFTGTWRRMEHVGTTAAGAAVFDDYAHHPTAIKATLAALKEAHPGKRLLTVFEPHMYSRTAELMDDFATAFGDADEVIIAPIYPAREAPIAGITAAALAARIAEHHEHVRHIDALSEIPQAVAHADSNTVIALLGAGDIYTSVDKVVE